MTREDARAYFIDSNERIISVVKDENSYNYKTQQIEDVFMRKTFEANEWAIKALEQEPCEDCISRQAVLNGLASIAKAKARSDAQKSLMGRVMFFTERLPSVTPQQRTGRWIPVGYDGYADGNPVYDWWECSECGWEHTGDEESLTAFCPNCGAKMEV